MDSVPSSPNAPAVRVEPLRKRADFLRVQGSKYRFSRPSFLLTCLPLPSLGDIAAVGFTVTKKQGNAVMRNRIKRRLRAASQTLLLAQAQPGYAYVWIARDKAADISFTELEADMRWAVRKLHEVIRTDPNPQEGGQMRGRGSKKHKTKTQPASPLASGAE